jgi:hypothetical protein
MTADLYFVFVLAGKASINSYIFPQSTVTSSNFPKFLNTFMIHACQENYVPNKNSVPPQNTAFPSVTSLLNALKTKINQSYITRVSLCIRADRVFFC